VQGMSRSLFPFLVVACSFVLLAYGQEAESIGDLARQARQQKQNKNAQSKAAPTSKTPKVITNDEIPGHPEAAETTSISGNEVNAETSPPSGAGGARASAEQWKSLIRAQKSLVGSLQSGIDKLNESNLPQATVLPAACSGTNGKSKSSRKWNGCARI